MNTHRNVVFTAQVYRDWVRAGQDGGAMFYPRTVEMRDELPKTVTGKILRRELRG